MEGCSTIRWMSFPMLAVIDELSLPVIGQDVVSQLDLLDLARRQPCCLS